MNVQSSGGVHLGRASYALQQHARHVARGRASVWVLAVWVPDYAARGRGRSDRRGRWDRAVDGDAQAARLVNVIVRDESHAVSPAGET